MDGFMEYTKPSIPYNDREMCVWHRRKVVKREIDKREYKKREKYEK
jgi:hypothetical protein